MGKSNNLLLKIALLMVGGRGKLPAQRSLKIDSNSYLGYRIIFPYSYRNKIKEITRVL